nr:hypothetical protein [uncultured Acetatifactor sp.]
MPDYGRYEESDIERGNDKPNVPAGEYKLSGDDEANGELRRILADVGLDWKAEEAGSSSGYMMRRRNSSPCWRSPYWRASPTRKRHRKGEGEDCQDAAEQRHGRKVEEDVQAAGHSCAEEAGMVFLWLDM